MGQIITLITIVTEPNSPLAYDLGAQPHRLIMSKLGCHGGQFEINTESRGYTYSGPTYYPKC